MRDLAGRTVVVTGGGSGIGQGYCQAFAEAGMNVVVSDLDEESARATVELITPYGGRTLAAATDVSDPDSMKALADAAYDAFGRVDLVCLNAGIGHYLPFHETPYEVWRRMVDTNIFGSINGMLAFWDRMRAQDGEKHVVVTSSAAGLVLRTNPPRTAYQTTKYALVGFCESLAAEGAEFGIGVSCVCPGPVATGLSTNSRRLLGVAPPAAPAAERNGAAPANPEHRMTPIEVGRWVRRSVERNEFWVFTHYEVGRLYDRRTHTIRSAFDQSWRDFQADEQLKSSTAQS